MNHKETKQMFKQRVKQERQGNCRANSFGGKKTNRQNRYQSKLNLRNH